MFSRFVMTLREWAVPGSRDVFMGLLSPERLAAGYVIVLPGIEGHSLWNRSVVQGLVDAGIPYGIEIYDWTWTSYVPLINLRFGRHHHAQADIIAAKIADYRLRHPTSPVYLIGHSGGGAMTLYSLAKLTGDLSVTGGILLGPAISPVFNVQPALARTTRGLWNFSSIFDVVFLAAGTTVFGTVDGWHRISAGCLGFRNTELPAGAPPPVEPYVREVPFRAEMLRCLNLGGHFGYVSRRFVAQWLAPILRGNDVPTDAVRKIVRGPREVVSAGSPADRAAPSEGTPGS